MTHETTTTTHIPFADHDDNDDEVPPTRRGDERAFSWSEVDEIRARLVATDESAHQIAAEYGAAHTTVAEAARGAPPYDGVGNHPPPVYRPEKYVWELPDDLDPEHTVECRLCSCEFDPTAEDSAGLHCSDLCASYDSDEDRRFGGLDDRPRDLLIRINDHPDEDHTEALVELHDAHDMSPNRLAQHTPFGDVTIRETLRSEGVYHGTSQPKREPEFRARYEDECFGPEKLGLSPIGEVATQRQAVTDGGVDQ